VWADVHIRLPTHYQISGHGTPGINFWLIVGVHCSEGLGQFEINVSRELGGNNFNVSDSINKEEHERFNLSPHWGT